MVRHVIEWAFACENRSVTQRLRPQPRRCRPPPARTVPLPDSHSPDPNSGSRILREPFRCPTATSPTPCCHRPCPARADPLLDGYAPNPAVAGRVLREPAHYPTATAPNMAIRGAPCENRSVTLQPRPKHHIWSCGRREPAYCPKNQPLRMIPARIRCVSSADESIPGPKTVYDKLGCIRTNGRGTPAWQSLLTRPVRFTASS